MDLKVTKERFNEHWTYDWIKYIAFILVAVMFVSLLFSVTARKLTDSEELRIVVYSKYCSVIEPYETNDDPRDYILSLNLTGSEYLDNEYAFYPYGNSPEEKQAAQAKLEADQMMNNIDLLLLPMINANYTGSKNDYFDKDDNIVAFSQTFEYHAGVGFYIPLDEVIQNEVQKCNQAAIELQNLFNEKPEYFYWCNRVTPNSDMTDIFVHDATARPYGINLNALNRAKVNAFIHEEDLVTGNEESLYAMGIRKDCNSHAESIAFLNWFIKNYA